MSNTTVCYHAEASDMFSAEIVGEGPAYAVVKIREHYGVPVFTLFTPSGINCAADYLREFRYALNGAIAKLEEMGSVKEAE